MAAWIVKKANSRAIVCFLLKMAMWVLFAGWLALWVWRPLKSWGKPWETVMDTATTSYFGKAGLEFNPMSIILLKLPCLSLLQWHPFSIISTSSIDCDRFSILIKCRRSWTQKLEKFMAYLNWMERPLHLEAAIEGPYGPASSYFLRYETLFLIGGGSGIAPLLSILSEILHQHSIRKENHVPTEVILIWAVRQSEELCILNLISPSMICPKFSEVLQLEVQAYITKEVAPDSEMGTTSPNTEDPIKSINFPEDNKCAGSVCSLSSTNNILWQAAIIACAVVGFFAAIGLLNHFYIYPIDHNTYEVYPWRARVLVTISCMIVGIVIFGSLVFVVWRRNNTSGKLGTSYTHSFEMSETKSNISSEDDDQDQLQDTILTKCKVHYGQQPDLQGRSFPCPVKILDQDNKKVLQDFKPSFLHMSPPWFWGS